MPNQLTTSDGVTLTRDTFITHYVAAWLAAKSVQDHAIADAARGYSFGLDHPYVGNALYCAQKAWAELERINP